VKVNAIAGGSKSLEHRTVTTLAPHGSRPLKSQEEVYEMGASIADMEEVVAIWTFRMFCRKLARQSLLRV